MDPDVKYRPNDQEEKLGPPPWSGLALQRWEEEHGHDARLPCTAEDGCYPALTELYEENARLRELLRTWGRSHRPWCVPSPGHDCPCGWDAVERELAGAEKEG